MASHARTVIPRLFASNKPHFVIASSPVLVQRRHASDTSVAADLLVEYLEGQSKGIVVFGLNRPQVGELHQLLQL